jgi:hypothetical protein
MILFGMILLEPSADPTFCSPERACFAMGSVFKMDTSSQANGARVARGGGWVSGPLCGPGRLGAAPAHHSSHGNNSF